ncbi:MAG: hypothetical protein BWZ10_02475 [candidate division BRC1 bacterium ADurb.BinA364]|nr:MAG: hypothetical protein BWZ10_02475 [candidate division BRC1 bacterium ADurb.BinA364]
MLDARKHLAQRPPDHQLDQPADGCPGDRARADAFAIAQNGVRIGHARHFLEEMADVDDGDAGALQPADRLEQRLGFFGRKRTGRLVHDDQRGIRNERAGDFDDLPLADAETAHGDIERQIGMAQQRQRFAHALAFGADEAQARPLDAEHDVGLGVEMGSERQLLIDHRDAERPARRRRVDLALRPAKTHDAFVGPQRPRKDFHQRAFARAVFADQGMNLAPAHTHADAPQGPGGSEGLAHIGEFKQQIVGHGNASKGKRDEAKGKGRRERHAAHRLLSSAFCLIVSIADRRLRARSDRRCFPASPSPRRCRCAFPRPGPPMPGPPSARPDSPFGKDSALSGR